MTQQRPQPLAAHDGIHHTDEDTALALVGGGSATSQLPSQPPAPTATAPTEQQLRCPLCAKELLDMGCFDCGAVEWECEDYPELCSYTTGYCVCGDYTLSAQPTAAL